MLLESKNAAYAKLSFFVSFFDLPPRGARIFISRGVVGDNGGHSEGCRGKGKEQTERNTRKQAVTPALILVQPRGIDLE